MTWRYGMYVLFSDAATGLVMSFLASHGPKPNLKKPLSDPGLGSPACQAAFGSSSRQAPPGGFDAVVYKLVSNGPGLKLAGMPAYSPARGGVLKLGEYRFALLDD